MTYIEEIMKFEPQNSQEENDKRVILDYINQFPTTILTRENEFAHITSSGFIMNSDLTKVLMVFHNIYNTWAWTGGHADGDGNLLNVAKKEALEETGITSVKPLTEKIISLDILPVNGHFKHGRYVSTHLHLSIAYVLLADESEPLHIKEDENSGVAWIDVEKLSEYCKEEHILPIYEKIIGRARNL